MTEIFKDAAMCLVNSGSSRLKIYRDANNNDGRAEDQNNAAYKEDDGDDDKDDSMTDMSKCMQLMGGSRGTSEQLYGCSVCVFWLIRESRSHPKDNILDLLDCMEHELNERGMNRLLATLTWGDDEASGAAASAMVDDLLNSHHVLDLWATLARWQWSSLA